MWMGMNNKQHTTTAYFLQVHEFYFHGKKPESTMAVYTTSDILEAENDYSVTIELRI